MQQNTTPFTTIFISADHGGFDLAQWLTTTLKEKNYPVEYCGPQQLEPQDDYPKRAFALAEKVAGFPGSKGILLCRSGAGMTIAANKVRAIRAATARSQEEAKHAREHNNANVIAVSADWVNQQQALQVIETFLNTPASTEERHQRRIDQITKYELEHTK